MSKPGYEFTVDIPVSFQDAERRTRELLKEEGLAS